MTAKQAGNVKNVDWRKGVLLRDCVGRRFRTTRQLTNGRVRLPQGFPVTIHRGYRWNDITIIADVCHECGVQPIMDRVSYADLEPA